MHVVWRLYTLQLVAVTNEKYTHTQTLVLPHNNSFEMTKIVHKHSPRQTRHSFVCPSDQPSSKREENMRKVRRNMIVTAKYRSRTVGYPCPGTDGRGVEVKFYFIHSSSLRPQTASHPAQTFSSEGRLPTTTFGGKRS